MNDCADIVGGSNLVVVSGGFVGDWKAALAHGKDWQERFPSPYHLCLEICIEQGVLRHWKGEELALVFAEQQQYAKRADEIWRTHRFNGFWPEIVSLIYKPMRSEPALQCADMLAYETFRCIGNPILSEWTDFPLMAKLLIDRPEIIGAYHNEESFARMMLKSEENGRRYLKKIPVKQICGSGSIRRSP